MTTRHTIDENGKIIFTCEGCSTLRKITLPKGLKKPTINVTCKDCNTVTNLYINLRGKKRRPVNINGSIMFNEKRYSIIIIDISLSGIQCKFFRDDILKLGDIVNISYTIPNKALTIIEEAVKIVRIEQCKGYINFGAESLNQEEYTTSYRKKGFFLMEINPIK